ncbi:MAG: DNA methyltransferase, partial [Pirellulales bacterium]
RSLTEPIVRTTLEPILKQLADLETDLPTVYDPSREDKRRYTAGELQARIRLSEKSVEVAKQAREVGTPHPSQILDLKICDPAMGSGAFLVETCRQLGDELIKAWYAHDAVPTDIPPDEDEVLYARRLIAQRCLYGVDKNVMAVDLAKLSLWLVTLAKDHPFTFLDHSLRHGDSLVGLTRRQIIGFHWEPKKQKQFGEDLIQKRLDRATEARAKILNARENVPYRDQEQRLTVADEALNVVRLTGDACLNAFFGGSKKKEREERCEELFASVSDWYSSGHDINRRRPIAEAATELRSGEHPIPPFHWEIEFPEVFSRENGGFDAFVGNPPFLGGRRTTSVFGDSYRDYLALFPESSSNADLCSFFFRRCFDQTRRNGVTGLIATNSIAQGDTRESGLCWLCENGANILEAKRRYKWPGDVAVVVSVVHVVKGELPHRAILDGKPTERITAYLFHTGPNRTPPRLAQNVDLDFQGSIILGTGFTFGESEESGQMSSLGEMEALISDDSRNRDRVFPFIGGAELNDTPTYQHKRYVINFGEMTEAEARTWPALFAIVEEKVKPERAKQKRKHLRERWWQHAETRPAMYRAIRPLERVLATSQVCAHLSFAFMPSTTVFSNKLTIFPLDRFCEFACLQSRCHEIWARFFSGSAMDLLRYTPRDCFQTFPFTQMWRSDPILEEAGRIYYEHRAQVMVANDEGLTSTYNRFHDPHEKSSEIAHLRELHAEMDRAVLEAYGWDDLAQSAHCEFLLDYEEEDDDEPGAKKSKKKKPWRLRWPDEFRDEVLARLLE